MCPPILSNNSSVSSLKDCDNFSNNPTGSEHHFCRKRASSDFRFVSFGCSYTYLLRIDHKFSIWFKSGLFLGHTPVPHVLQVILSKSCFVAFEVWLGTSSCWKFIFFLLGNNKEESISSMYNGRIASCNKFQWQSYLFELHTRCLPPSRKSSSNRHFLTVFWFQRGWNFTFFFCSISGGPSKLYYPRFVRKKNSSPSMLTKRSRVQETQFSHHFAEFFSIRDIVFTP